MQRHGVRVGTRASRRKSILIVLFVPSVERDGRTKIDQARWVRKALDVLGSRFGGATAFPRARGVWRDDERGGVLVCDEPVVIHSYTSAESGASQANLRVLVDFCRELGRATRQGEVGLVIDNTYWAITDFGRE